MSGTTEYNKEKPQSGLVTSVLRFQTWWHWGRDLNTRVGDSSAHNG